MTDILLDSQGNVDIVNGDVVLIADLATLTHQRLINRLKTFKGTLFTNINYGALDDNIIFQKGTKDLLDESLKYEIELTQGIVRLINFTSSVSPERVYTCNFTYSIETGEIVGVSELPLSLNTGQIAQTVGIWKNGVWDYSGVWDFEEEWGTGEASEGTDFRWFLRDNLLRGDGIIYGGYTL